MLRKTLLILFAFLGISAGAQQTTDQQIGSFNQLKVFDLIEVELIQSHEERVVIKGKNTEDINVINDKGILTLRKQNDHRFDDKQTLIEVYFTQVDILEANEGARIVANAVIEQNNIELRAQEGGLIKVNLNVNNATMNAATEGILKISGTAASQQVVLNTEGILEGKEFKTEECKISVTAAGNAEVFASRQAQITVNGGGYVRVYGNPSRVEQKSFGGGRIIVRDE